MSNNNKWHWVVEVAVEAASRTDKPKLIGVLDMLSSVISDFSYRLDDDSGQIILGADDELGLEVALERIRTAGPCGINVGAPQVCFRETILKIREIDHTHDRWTNDRSEFARVKVRVEPLDIGAGIEFGSEYAMGALPSEYVSAVQTGVNQALDTGVLAGFPMLDLKVTLVDGAFHATRSDAKAFETAGRAAALEALKGARPVLLEPIVKLEIMTPEDFVGDVIGDLNARRGKLFGHETLDGSATVAATVPVSQMFGYVNSLAQMTANRASHTARFSHYERVPTWPDDPPGTEPAAAALRA